MSTAENAERSSYRLVFIGQLLLLPLILAALFICGTAPSVWCWALMGAAGLALLLLLTQVRTERQAQKGPELEMIPPERQPPVVREVMRVSLAITQGGIDIFRGRLLEAPGMAYEKLARFFGHERTPLLREDDQLGAAIVVVPERQREAALDEPPERAVPSVLFVLTFVTTTFVGALHQGADPLTTPAALRVGLPYALSLMAILGLHELGHYVLARRHRMRVSLPFFIPVPFALGTFGAFIKMRSPAPNRRALFDVAVAGPLAGLLVAVPALWIGLQSSAVVPITPSHLPEIQGGALPSSSILFSLIASLSLNLPASQPYAIHLGPLAFAGWLGLMVTALNLVPVGQLDGGHIAYSVFGQRWGSVISTVSIWSLFLLALFVWPGLLLWAIIVFFLAGRRTPPLNDISPLSPGRKVLGLITLLIFASIVVPYPLPLSSWDALQSPYA